MIVHLNGVLMDARSAMVSPFDRGFLFGDGLYEGIRAVRGRTIAMPEHLERLANGMREIGLAGFDPQFLIPATEALLRANNLPDAFVYWQITRGTPMPGMGWRDRVPPAGMAPTLFGFAEPAPLLESYLAPRALKAALVPDVRWKLGHIKAITLLGSVLASQEAMRRGADDAILTRAESGKETIAEGTATNVIAVIDGEIVTPALESAPILGGVTRRLLIEIAPDIVQRVLFTDELRHASEIMLLGTRTMVASVIELDGRSVGPGAPGPVAKRLLAALCARMRAEVECAAARA